MKPKRGISLKSGGSEKMKLAARVEKKLSSSDGELESNAERVAEMLKAIGARIEQVRGKESQPDFAGRYNVHKNTLGRYERGERWPDADFMLALNVVDGINPAWLMLGEGPMRYAAGSIDQPAPQALVERSVLAVMHWLEAERRLASAEDTAKMVGLIFAAAYPSGDPAKVLDTYKLLKKVV